mgnify:FL=1
MLQQIDSLRARLLAWYDRNRRDLPWREGLADPYRVWLSEVMLQQTRVDTVRSYYTRWLDRFPTLASLAEAEQDDVLKAWEGLGYYSRARNFHAAVRQVAARYGGIVPGDPARFRALPGVGRYTAGAVMSIAFALPEPIVDGNVRRVFARLLDLPAPTDTELWDSAASIVEGERPGELNQSLMELGATTCTPRAPACERCPVEEFCLARTHGTERDRPRSRVKPPIPTEEHAVAVVMHAGKLLLVKRPDRGRLAGMWEFPGVLRKSGESLAGGAIRAAAELASVAAEPVSELSTVTHLFTHVKVNYRGMLMQTGEASALPDNAEWVTREEIGKFALPRAQQRILALITSSHTPPSAASIA